MLGREYYPVCHLFGTANLFFSRKLAIMMKLLWTWFVHLRQSLPVPIIASCR